jgi:GH43 family beta-xylosidase
MNYHNPLVEQRADPWIHRTAEGIYYFIATAPEYDRIEIRKADSINGITDARPKIVWRKHDKGVMGHHIWAPELHRINGVWYIYFAAGEAENIWQIRMYVLSNKSADPLEGMWVEEGRIKTKKDSFSLDATTFEHRGQRYLVWAQRLPAEKHNTALLISRMSSPTRLEGRELVLTRPELPWEKMGHDVNEGPAVLIKNGYVFLSYSASATDHNYAIGLLWAKQDSNLMNAASWHKLTVPVFTTNKRLKRFGPGHNSFTLAEDGKTDLLVYHARDYRDIEGNPLNDPNRHTRVRVLHWTESGWPDFGQDIKD